MKVYRPMTEQEEQEMKKSLLLIVLVGALVATGIISLFAWVASRF